MKKEKNLLMLFLLLIVFSLNLNANTKTNKGQCLMTEAPNTVDDKQLEELFIKSTYEK